MPANVDLFENSMCVRLLHAFTVEFCLFFRSVIITSLINVQTINFPEIPDGQAQQGVNLDPAAKSIHC